MPASSSKRHPRRSKSAHRVSGVDKIETSIDLDLEQIQFIHDRMQRLLRSLPDPWAALPEKIARRDMVLYQRSPSKIASDVLAVDRQLNRDHPDRPTYITHHALGKMSFALSDHQLRVLRDVMTFALLRASDACIMGEISQIEDVDQRAQRALFASAMRAHERGMAPSLPSS